MTHGSKDGPGENILTWANVWQKVQEIQARPLLKQILNESSWDLCSTLI